MSLINDALKQAGKTREVSELRTIPSLTLQPVEERDRPQNVMLYVLPVLLLVILAMAGWFLWQWWRDHQAAMMQVPAKVIRSAAPSTPAPVVATAAVAPESAPAPSTAPADKRPSLINQLVGSIFASSPVPAPQPTPAVAPVSTVAPPQTPSAPVAPPRPFPVLKLQGVFYRAVNASALLNGQIVYLGSKVDGVEVVNIDKQSVTVRFDGQTKVLHLRN